VRPPSRDDLTLAWPEVMGTLAPRVRMMLAAGRFVETDAGGVGFALPNAAHVARATEHAGALRQALAAHFGSEVAIDLVVDPAGVRTEEAPVAEEEGTADHFDAIAEGSTDAGAFSSLAETKILEAFPGAVEVVE
jgi:hypothetical protein